MFPYEPRGQKRVSGAPELELQMVMNWLTWVLGTKLWSFNKSRAQEQYTTLTTESRLQPHRGCCCCRWFLRGVCVYHVAHVTVIAQVSSPFLSSKSQRPTSVIRFSGKHIYPLNHWIGLWIYKAVPSVPTLLGYSSHGCSDGEHSAPRSCLPVSSSHMWTLGIVHTD